MTRDTSSSDPNATTVWTYLFELPLIALKQIWYLITRRTAK